MTMSRRILSIVLYVTLLLVVLSEVNTLWIGVTNPARFRYTFPGATGALFVVALSTSLAAGLNAVMIWLRKRWAVWLNIVIGLWAMGLIEILQGPRVNELVILVACALSTALPLVLWDSSMRVSIGKVAR